MEQNTKASNTRRVSVSFTSISWIPSEAIAGFMRLPMDVGLGHYDPPPPDRIDDLATFVAQERCRFANHLSAWADIGDGRVTASGTSGGGLVACTRVGAGSASISVPAVGFPELRSSEHDSDRSVTFVQTAGGRTGAPFPRRAGPSRRFRLRSPTAWTTLAVTINGDGSTQSHARGASDFPRHWFYDNEGVLTAKSPTIDFAKWTEKMHESDTPWGHADHEIHVTACESALERMLSAIIMSAGKKPRIRVFEPGEVIMTQGEPAHTLELVLDGLVEIEVDGHVLAESGPGSVLGERACLDCSNRTATVRAVTRVKTAQADPDSLGDIDLIPLRDQHDRRGPGTAA